MCETKCEAYHRVRPTPWPMGSVVCTRASAPPLGRPGWVTKCNSACPVGHIQSRTTSPLARVAYQLRWASYPCHACCRGAATPAKLAAANLLPMPCLLLAACCRGSATPAMLAAANLLPMPCLLLAACCHGSVTPAMLAAANLLPLPSLLLAAADLLPLQCLLLLPCLLPRADTPAMLAACCRGSATPAMLATVGLLPLPCLLPWPARP